MKISPQKQVQTPSHLTGKFGDRFLPSRSSQLVTFDKLSSEAHPSDESSTAYSLLLESHLLPNKQKSLLHYTKDTELKENKPRLVAPEAYTPLKSQRKVPKAPYKVLDAPNLQDDFYLNVIDWSSANMLGVGLGTCVYLWCASSSKVTKLCDLGLQDSVASVAWMQSGTHLAIGTSQGALMLWDANRRKLIRSFHGHNSRLGALSWNGNYFLSSGSRDRQILHRDMRCPADYVGKLLGHKQEVCGLKWSFDGQQLSSGGNDNRLVLWSLHSCNPVAKFTEHTAAVKALAWSPNQHGLLASGGGTADRTIRLWNTLTAEQLEMVDTGSQVCNLMFSKNSKELISTHGYSLNQILLWKCPSMNKVATLSGHTYRVLYLSMSPDGQTIVTGAGDETLRFWQAFPSDYGPGQENVSSLVPSFFEIR